MHRMVNFKMNLLKKNVYKLENDFICFQRENSIAYKIKLAYFMVRVEIFVTGFPSNT